MRSILDRLVASSNGRVRMHIAGEVGGAERDYLRSGCSGIFHHDVEMDLLATSADFLATLRPRWSDMIGHPLEGQPRRVVVVRDDHLFAVVIRDGFSEQAGVELREDVGVGAIEDDMVKAADHGPPYGCV